MNSCTGWQSPATHWQHPRGSTSTPRALQRQQLAPLTSPGVGHFDRLLRLAALVSHNLLGGVRPETHQSRKSRLGMGKYALAISQS